MFRVFTSRRTSTWVVLASIFLSTLIVTGGQPVERTPINVERWQYDAASAKWNSQHVEEYEETIRAVECRFKMTVTIERSTGNALEKVTHIESADAGETHSTLCADAVSGETLTIGQLYSSIDFILANSSKAASTFDGSPVYYAVEFDQARGYLRHAVIAAGDRADEITVESLKVLKPLDQR